MEPPQIQAMADAVGPEKLTVILRPGASPCQDIPNAKGAPTLG
jgi:hypothetical protein